MVQSGESRIWAQLSLDAVLALIFGMAIAATWLAA
jgi:hypothetical protein